MTGAMYAAIAGLRTHMSKMNVIGNNIANVNTAGYKSQRTIFKDAIYTMYSNGSNGTEQVGGKNPAQIGYGSQISSIDLNMASGSFNPGRSTDCTISGDGFFLVGDKTIAGQIDPNDPTTLAALNLTRVGDFEFKADGYLCDGSGNPVYGFLTTGVDKDGKPIVSDQLVPIRLPRVDDKGDVQYPTATDPADPNKAGPLKDAVGKDAAGNEIELPKIQLEGLSVNPDTGAISGFIKGQEKPIVIGFLAIGNVTNPGGLTHDEGFYYKAADGAGDLSVSMLGGYGKELGIGYVNGSLVDTNANPDAKPSNKMAIGNAGGTKLITGGLEGSNVDLATEISEMITTQRGYQANSRIITVTDSMLEELVNMKR